MSQHVLLVGATHLSTPSGDDCTSLFSLPSPTFSNDYTENNSTVTVLRYSKLCVSLRLYNDIAFGVVAAAACQACIFICAVLMFKALRQSVELKNSRHLHVEAKTRINGLSKREKDVKVAACLEIPELAENSPADLGLNIDKATHFLADCLGFITIDHDQTPAS
ncbi:P2Y purinoceptor 2 [Biomphalaria pfeifferi]|uniref:P2Y purinoceptor 2 n=1 Tax=Biomphalaria pfeifferi TaxID=112525 RepID=A0AAD8F967_BIOPF|nr:P2Y purinoceptor 2 [Biomphalaria pfeifferi]